MKTQAFARPLAFTLALLLSGTAASLAAEAWKEAEAGGAKIYTDTNGMTLYTYDRDGDGVSNCYDTCATNWPPLPAAADAQPQGDWTIVERTDGSRMWAYEGKPVYTFARDQKPGDTTGDGVNDVWHIVKAD
ncbi:COG4315 family predicted lipoprotein [Aquamicrobium defluvii]|uniref:Putative lipoprotein with Yx(FWY)xxD motif n=1 Tax=Aquamicrobium defluvii TaxID=69279 RepID=A0A011TBU5_9HYPH|nr:hypothetical protein [Aquamicrobium defluvii]EXL09109.1 hypothetical protein BG36_24320 [Aquamicrobium defluvii]EZQ15409.1 hypothetical protein CF98_11955 [Halopseudomonas bauzanensis]TDR32259.1 putative lipoprotein with Yx(FWY)xxD motif [Aquamicrobium defluvii]